MKSNFFMGLEAKRDQLLYPIVLDSILKPIVMLPWIMRTQFIKDVEEYQKLTARQWYKRRKLEQSIAISAKYWLEDIKKMWDKKRIIEFRRHGELKEYETPRRTSNQV